MKQIPFDEHYTSMLTDIKGEVIRLLDKIRKYEAFIDRLKTTEGYKEWIKTRETVNR